MSRTHGMPAAAEFRSFVEDRPLTSEELTSIYREAGRVDIRVLFKPYSILCGKHPHLYGFGWEGCPQRRNHAGFCFD